MNTQRLMLIQCRWGRSNTTTKAITVASIAYVGPPSRLINHRQPA